MEAVAESLSNLDLGVADKEMKPQTMQDKSKDPLKTPTKEIFKKPSRLSLPPQRSQSKKAIVTPPVVVKPAWNDAVLPVVEKTRTKLKPVTTPFKTTGPVNQLRGPFVATGSGSVASVTSNTSAVAAEPTYHMLYLSEKQKNQKLLLEIKTLKEQLKQFI
jgi:hypothetical protein